jgi:malonyl-CoA/methylmalonyl-CoA synthetase
MFPRLLDDPDRLAAELPDGRLTYGELASASAGVAAALHDGGRVALWMTPTAATIVGLVGALRAGVAVIPLNPKSGEMELAHVLADAAPAAVLAGRGAELAPALRSLTRIDVGVVAGGDSRVEREPPGDAPALILYTSGTTGRPKGVVQTRASVIANLDALAEAWRLSGADVVAHSLPLFHVHGLVLGTIGPLRLGARVRHLGSFDVQTTARALEQASVMFGVPTMYHRLAAAAERDPRVAAALARPRLLASGSAALPVDVHRTIERLTGRTVIERYGMTETLIIASTRPGAASRPGYVGTPLPGVSIRVSGEDGTQVPLDDETMGTVWVRGPSVFREHVNREAPAGAFDGDWFDTGDVGVLAPDGALRLVGRAASDMIKSGGYRIAAGEIEAALLTHPAVSEAAVCGMPDAELGERIVAWVVTSEHGASDGELVEHVVARLTPHKRPREINRLDSLPRNELGKVQKQRLVSV